MTNNDQKETLYSPLKRMRFFVDALKPLLNRDQPPRILEIGCGTGEGILMPLHYEFGEQAHLVGIDSHEPSIQYAQEKTGVIPNNQLEFILSPAESLPDEINLGSWDVVILSEVIEHVPSPHSLFETANKLLKDGGLLLVTIPNGYGPFEFENLFWYGLGFEKGMAWLRKKRGKKPFNVSSPHTLNDDNRHVAFYSFGNMKKLLSDYGFAIQKAKNREFFCGPFSDIAFSVLKRVRIEALLVFLSQGLAPVLPRFAVSDWMIQAQKKSSRVSTVKKDYPTGFFGKWWWKTKRRQVGFKS